MIQDAVILKPKVKYWLDGLLLRYEVIAPADTGRMIEYIPIERGEDALLEFGLPPLPPKQYFFPKTDTLFTMQIRRGAATVQPAPIEAAERVIFGILPFDAKALLIMDKQLLRPNAIDPYYQARRQRTTLVGIGDSNPNTLNFSVSAGSGPFDEEGLDLLFYDMDKEFYVKVITEKGKKLLDDNFSLPEEHHRKLSAEIKKKAEEKAQYNLNMERWKRYSPLEIFQLPYWSEAYLPCIECGACTYVCPTTVYSRAVDVLEESSGSRCRVWDSPYFERFAVTPENFNPRPTLKDRFRDWVLEKFLFFPQESGFFNCVGCGRCILNCPTQIDFRKVVAGVRFE